MRVRILWLSGVLGLALGCAASRPQTSPSPVPTTAAADSKGRIPVRIDNQNYSDLDVYLLSRGTRVLLGSVTGLTRATLMLPTGSALTDGRVQLQADPLGAVAPIRTPQLLVSPGEQVYWTIGADRADSYASVG
jgi:hypothetical protein